MRIGGHHGTPRRQDEAGLIVQLAQDVVVERSHEELANELRHRTSAAAMDHLDPTVTQIERPHIAGLDCLRDTHCATTATSLKRPYA